MRNELAAPRRKRRRGTRRWSWSGAATPIAAALTLAAPLLFGFTGCSRHPERIKVSGQVLIDGEPLRYGQVRFVPKGGRPSDADLDQEGRFTLHSFGEDDGAALGVHQIAVFANEQLDLVRTKWHAPKRYSYYDSSGLTKEITGPTDSLVIELTWKGDPKGKPYIEEYKGPVEATKTGK